MATTIKLTACLVLNNSISIAINTVLNSRSYMICTIWYLQHVVIKKLYAKYPTI